MSADFRWAALEEGCRDLDRLPRPLWLQAIVNGRGRLGERLADLVQLRAALGEGRLPPSGEAWPLAPALEPFLDAIERLDLPRLSAQGEGIADQVVQTLLWHADRIADHRDEAADDGTGEGEAAAARRAADEFAAEWQPVAADLEDVLNVFNTLAFCRTGSLDALRGVLRSQGWQELLRIHRLVEGWPGLRELFRRLGRRAPAEEDEDSAAPARVDVVARALREREVQIPGLVAETRGVTRGGAVSRMLPGEMAILRHPTLRMVWFARLAERSLMVYEDRDRLLERVPVEAPAPLPVQESRPRPRRERGPLLMCVDTSGSMAGAAENVAKAVILEGMRLAAAQGRACYVYAFGGPGEVLEREFGVDVGGIAEATAFMAQGFGGGTDICEPLQRAMARIGEKAWREADLVIASDGEFGATPALANEVRRARQALGLRVQGILIGDRETLGLLELCDDIFWVDTWRKFGGSGADTPVHSRSLTAIYFPGALRS